MQVAFLLRELLSKLHLKSFAKVSGSKGIQLYVPLNTPVTYDATQPFARAIAELLEREHRNLVVSEMAKNLALEKCSSFTEWTNYGLLRHATFQGLREDKNPREAIREIQA